MKEIYFEYENIKTLDFIDCLAIIALMKLNIPAEEWLKEREK